MPAMKLFTSMTVSGMNRRTTLEMPICAPLEDEEERQKLGQAAEDGGVDVPGKAQRGLRRLLGHGHHEADEEPEGKRGAGERKL